ncbi:unnamed protein product [Sphagnum troendelagicum]
MFSSSGEEVPAEQVTQEILEQRLVRRFDFFNVQSRPQRGAAILRFLGSGVVRLVGTDPDEAREGDRLLRVKHGGSRSRLISWKIWRNQEEGWRFQQESADEQNFTIVPSTFEPLKPIMEGAQSEFDG